MKKILMMAAALSLVFSRVTAVQAQETKEPETIVLAAAASLKYVFDDQLIPRFEEEHPEIRVEATYDSSGKLQAQIEEGAEWDIFFSAGVKQMDALQEAGLMADDTVRVQVTNELVLITPGDSALGIEKVTDILKADYIAIGDPADVPVGQYTQKTLQKIAPDGSATDGEDNLWNAIQTKNLSLGTNVTEVLNWVAEGSADCGFTYRTDAMQKAEEVEIVEGLAPATYPIGVIASSGHPEAAEVFLEYLSGEEALEQFTAYGFTLPEAETAE